MKEKLLFICSANVDRSPTAELYFKKEYDTKSCGTTDYAVTPISKDNRGKQKLSRKLYG